MQSNKRIIVTGASGVGKTTLVEMLAPLLSLSVIPELGRKICQDLGYQKIGNIPDQEGFKRKVLAAQIEAEEKAGSFISDRSTIDCWALWQRWNICQAMTFDTESYYEQARDQSKTYTHIIYIAPMFAPVEDGFRWTETDYQRQIDRLVRTTIFDWQLSDITYVVQSSDSESRRTEILSWLNAQSSIPTSG